MIKIKVVATKRGGTETFEFPIRDVSNVQIGMAVVPIKEMDFFLNASYGYKLQYIEGIIEDEKECQPPRSLPEFEEARSLPEFKKVDVTIRGEQDGECLPIQCVCGYGQKAWEFVIDIYKDAPAECPMCGREYYFCDKGVEIYARNPTPWREIRGKENE